MFGFGKKKELVINAPVAGAVKPVSGLPDESFSKDVLGPGIAIEPMKGRVVAPADGEIRLMFETGHALSMAADNGAELLIHVGIDTVKLKGKHFTKIKNTDDVVKAGDVLLEFDADAIRTEGYDPVTVVVVLNPDEFSGIRFTQSEAVEEGDALIYVQPDR